MAFRKGRNLFIHCDPCAFIAILAVKKNRIFAYLMFKITKENKFMHLLVLFVLALVWGSSFLMQKRGLESFTSIEAALIRISSAFLTMLPFVFFTYKKVRRSDWKVLIVISIIGCVIPIFLYAEGQTRVDSFIAGILNTLVPVFTLVVGILFYRIVTNKWNILGLIAAFLSAVMLVFETSEGVVDFDIKYSLYLILASFCYAVNTNILKKAMERMDPVVLVVYPLMIVGPLSVIGLLFFTDAAEHYSTSSSGMESLIALLFMGVLVSALAPIWFNKLIHATSALFGTSVTYVMPIIALMLGVWDGEEFRLIYLLWIALILTGIFMVSIKTGKE
jgi:drug/metabolite transporter (DMT)-like permease